MHEQGKTAEAMPGTLSVPQRTCSLLRLLHDGNYSGKEQRKRKGGGT